MKTMHNTNAAMVKKLAKEIINHVNEYQAAERTEATAVNARQWDSAQTQKAASATEMMAAMHQMLSELGCVLSIEGLCEATEYYVIEKKSF